MYCQSCLFVCRTPYFKYGINIPQITPVWQSLFSPEAKTPATHGAHQRLNPQGCSGFKLQEFTIIITMFDEMCICWCSRWDQLCFMIKWPYQLISVHTKVIFFLRVKYYYGHWHSQWLEYWWFVVNPHIYLYWHPPCDEWLKFLWYLCMLYILYYVIYVICSFMSYLKLISRMCMSI